MENLLTLNNFFDGRDESWFYLITVELEGRGAAAIVPMMLTIDAIQRYNEEQEHSLRKNKPRAGSTVSVTSTRTPTSRCWTRGRRGTIWITRVAACTRSTPRGSC